MMRSPFLRIALLALAACDAPGPLKADRDAEDLFGPSEDNVVVIDAVLIVEAPLPYVDLRRTVAPGRAYSAETTALSGARVTIREGESSYVYTPDPAVAGRYQPPPAAPSVQPSTAYELSVEVPEKPIVRASTTTPPRMRISEFVLLDDDLEELKALRLFSEVGDAVYEIPENQLEFAIGALEVRVQMGGAPASFQFAFDNLEAASPLLFDSDLIDEDDYDLERSGTSRPLRLHDGALYLPWDGIQYAGRQRIRLFAVDRNWFDLVRTDNVDAERDAGEAGQGFQRPLFHVENGIGLFGSASVDSVGLFVRRKGSPPCSGCSCWGCGDRSSWSGVLDIESGKGRVRYERDVGTGAACDLSYEVRDAMVLETCASCSFAWKFELGELTVYEDAGACGEAEDLEGLELRFGQGVTPIADDSGATRYELYEEAGGFWGGVDRGWSLLLSSAGTTQWFFGFGE